MPTYLSNELAGTNDGRTTAAVLGTKTRGSVVNGRVKRFRATITLLRNASGGYDTQASLVAAGATSNAEQFNYVFPPQPELQKQANVFVGAFHETPIEAKVLIDSVRVTTGNPSSTAKGDQ